MDISLKNKTKSFKDNFRLFPPLKDGFVLTMKSKNPIKQSSD
jgi:hypothetical protein